MLNSRDAGTERLFNTGILITERDLGTGQDLVTKWIFFRSMRGPLSSRKLARNRKYEEKDHSPAMFI